MLEKRAQSNADQVDPTAPDILATLDALSARDSAHALSEGRHNTASYDVYYTGMETTRQQKVALTTAHLPVRNALIADMGFGTGGIDLPNSKGHQIGIKGMVRVEPSSAPLT